ncbi:MAG: hypothetical protein IKC80_02720 [Kiritimatiellae bacterium]|nr:hypothetical protein [Kiritimatiellia bacterium]
MTGEADIECGFAHVSDGVWLMGAAQPAAYRGRLTVRPLRGWVAPDRGSLRLVDVAGRASCSDAARPFVTRLDCAGNLTVVSDRILVAPAASRTASRLVRAVPMSFRYALAATAFRNPGWAVVATASRVNRFVLGEDDVLSVRMESAVAWTVKDPTGHCPRLTMRDILVPRRRGKTLRLNFYGPGVVWAEGAHGV